MKQRSDYIGILDGIRAYSILIVAGFHLWQQSWLQNLFPSNLLQFMGVRNFSLNWVPRTGYMFVDVMLLISGFCLFLPYARQMTDPLGPEPDNLRTFFKKRAARILPSYYLCLLLYLIFWVRPSDYANVKQYLQDFFAHLTFTQTFWPESYIGTKFPTALWTLGVEMQFYLVFPLLARVFRRFPLVCWAVLSVLAQVYIVLFAHLPQGNAESLRINQFPAFLGVYANGMLCALFFCRLRIWREREWKKNRILPLAALMLLLFSGAAIVCMLNDGLSRAAIIQRWQVDYRFLFSAMVCVSILLLDAAPKGVQWLFSNRIAAFLSAVSYNFYIWHGAFKAESVAHSVLPGCSGGRCRVAAIRRRRAVALCLAGEVHGAVLGVCAPFGGVFHLSYRKADSKTAAQKEENHPYIETDRHGVFHAFGGLSSYSVRVTENYSVLPSSFCP